MATKAIYDGSGKTCSYCGETKQLEEFNKSSRGKFGTRSNCRECQHKDEAGRYTSTTGAVKALRQRLKTRYNLTLEQYNEMVENQNKACAICGCVPEKLLIDHCHTTNNIRGLLCNQCNSMLGMAHDNIETLQVAIKYLQQPR